MKLYIFSVLLVIAGSYAAPQTEVGVAQERIADLWVINAVRQINAWMAESGLDPLYIKEHKIDRVFIDELLSYSVLIEELKFTGASNIELLSVNYNIWIGRLEFDLIVRELNLNIGNIEVNTLYGDRVGNGRVSGSFITRNISLKGNALLVYDHIGPYIYNIDVQFRIGGIESNMEIELNGDDLSENFNNLWNETVANLLETFKYEIDTIVGEFIKDAVLWWFS